MQGRDRMPRLMRAAGAACSRLGAAGIADRPVPRTNRAVLVDIERGIVDAVVIVSGLEHDRASSNALGSLDDQIAVAEFLGYHAGLHDRESNRLPRSTRNPAFSPAACRSSRSHRHRASALRGSCRHGVAINGHGVFVVRLCAINSRTTAGTAGAMIFLAR